MDIVRTPPPAAEGLAFDPVCGSPLPPLYGANRLIAGGNTYYFCSEMCRRFFIAHRGAEADSQSPSRPASPRTDS